MTAPDQSSVAFGSLDATCSRDSIENNVLGLLLPSERLFFMSSAEDSTFLKKLALSGVLQNMPREEAKELLKHGLQSSEQASEFLKWLASVDLFRTFPLSLFNFVATIAETNSS